jgi:hypothetical protein
MAITKKPVPPEDVIREDSEPPITEIKERPKNNPDEVEVDTDDALIEEPKDDVFRKSPQSVQTPERRSRKG